MFKVTKFWQQIVYTFKHFFHINISVQNDRRFSDFTLVLQSDTVCLSVMNEMSNSASIIRLRFSDNISELSP